MSVYFHNSTQDSEDLKRMIENASENSLVYRNWELHPNLHFRVNDEVMTYNMEQAYGLMCDAVMDRFNVVGSACNDLKSLRVSGATLDSKLYELGARVEYYEGVIVVHYMHEEPFVFDLDYIETSVGEEADMYILSAVEQCVRNVLYIGDKCVFRVVNEVGGLYDVEYEKKGCEVVRRIFLRGDEKCMIRFNVWKSYFRDELDLAEGRLVELIKELMRRR